MPKTKERVHREWFRTVMDKRKSCPSCHVKLAPQESVWSWGEYVRAKWRTVKHFCRECYPAIRADLRSHMKSCECTFELVGYRGECLPEWLTITEEGSACPKQLK